MNKSLFVRTDALKVLIAFFVFVLAIALNITHEKAKENEVYITELETQVSKLQKVTEDQQKQIKILLEVNQELTEKQKSIAETLQKNKDTISNLTDTQQKLVDQLGEVSFEDF